MADKTILVGCDPELFVWDLEENRYVSAHGMIEGTKDNPQLVDGGMVQVDGLALEFGIDPAENEDQFVELIATVRATLQDMIGDRYELRAEPFVTFDREVIEAQPPEALELGCEPDYNAYTGEANPTPVAEGNLAYSRSGGGHVHIGWGVGFDYLSVDHRRACQTLAAQLDFYLGMGSLGWDNCTDRRRLYGKAGAFRPKPYGMEYRTLSNAWVGSEELQREVFRRTIRGVSALIDGTYKFQHKINLFGGKVSVAPRNLIDSILFEHITDEKMRKEILDVQ